MYKYKFAVAFNFYLFPLSFTGTKSVSVMDRHLKAHIWQFCFGLNTCEDTFAKCD